MAKEQPVEADVVVVERVKSGFKVQLDNGTIGTAYLGDKMRKHFSHIVPGNMVKVALSPYVTMQEPWVIGHGEMKENLQKQKVADDVLETYYYIVEQLKKTIANSRDVDNIASRLTVAVVLSNEVEVHNRPTPDTGYR